jgi:hypothetical protein
MVLSSPEKMKTVDKTMLRSWSPDLSVVVVTPDNYQTIRKTVLYLQAQTVRSRMEIMIVAPSTDQLGLVESDLDSFFSYM